jgi:hypothetical protein
MLSTTSTNAAVVHKRKAGAHAVAVHIGKLISNTCVIRPEIILSFESDIVLNENKRHFCGLQRLTFHHRESQRLQRSFDGVLTTTEIRCRQGHMALVFRTKSDASYSFRIVMAAIEEQEILASFPKTILLEESAPAQLVVLFHRSQNGFALRQL